MQQALFYGFHRLEQRGKYRSNPEALQGISLGTQVIAGVNTSAWCIYGLLIHDIWLPLGTLIVLPLALWTIVLKLKM